MLLLSEEEREDIKRDSMFAALANDVSLRFLRSMAKDRRAGVVDTRFQTHECEGLYVVDSGVFPTNLGVNPQHTIMAMARLAASRLC